MTERDDLLRRVARTDPYPNDRPLPTDLADSRPPVAILIQGGDDIDQVAPLTPARTARWWRGPAVAAAALVVALLVAIPIFLVDGDDGPAANTTAATVATTTVPTTVDEPANSMLVTPAIGATWTLVATVDDWLTEPVMLDGRYYATSRGLDEDTQEEVDGRVGGIIEDTGELWTSLDGVTWVPAETGDQKPAARADGATDGASVVVRRNPTADEIGILVADGLWASTDEETWREIALRPSNDDWVPTETTGGLGWVVYSPPSYAAILADGSELYQGPRAGNLGLWYTPDTEAWFEVTDLGPLKHVNWGGIREVGVLEAATVVRDNDILVYAYIGEQLGFAVSNPHTEVWRLELSVDPDRVAQETVPSTTNPAVADDGAASLDESAGLEWNPILSATRARSAPTAATCPEGTNPNAPGPIYQARPGEGPWNNQAAVFDTHAGRIVFLDETGETWTFDVCTNTWRQMNPTWAPYGDPNVFPIRNVGELVYDVDSDRTIAFGPNFVSVYDANTNTWTRQSPGPNADLGFGSPGLGAVYDPVSGLVLVVADDGELFGYDVETDQWTRIGNITEAREVTHEGQTQTLGPPVLVGYVAEADRLAFLGFDGAPFQDDGALINPRTGDTAPLTDPPDGVRGGFGSFSYATGGDTAYTYADGVCRLDPVSFDWDCSTGSQQEAMSSAMVYDPINSRVVVINNFCCTWPGTTVSDDVWAVDFDTGEQIELLAKAVTRTEMDGS